MLVNHQKIKTKVWGSLDKGILCEVRSILTVSVVVYLVTIGCSVVQGWQPLLLFKQF